MPKVEIPTFKSKEYKKIVREVGECFVFSAEGKREREDMARRSYKAYRAYIDEAKYPFPTKSNIAKYTADVATAVASELDALVQNPPLMRFYPRGATPKQHAEWMENLCAYYLDQLPVREELDDALTQLRLFGTCYVHTHWRIDTRQIGAWQRVPQPVPGPDGLPLAGPDGQPLTIEVPEYYDGERQVYFGPWFRTLHFTEVYPDHLEKYLQDGYFFAHRTMRDRRWLKQRAREGVYDAKAVARLLDKESGSSSPWEDFAPATGERLESTIKWQTQVGLGAQVVFADVEQRKWFEIIEFWCSDGYVTTVANGSYILRRRKNPFAHGMFPFAMCRNFHIPGEHYGMSDWEAAGKLYNSHNDMHNAALTQGMLCTFPPLVRTPDVDERQLRQRGFRDIWLVKNPTGRLEFLELPKDGLMVAQALTADLGSAIDILLGTSDAYKGSVADGSATSIATAIQRSGLRMGYHVGNIGEMIKNIGQHWQEMIRQHQTKDITVKVTGDPNAQVLVPIEQLRDADLICSPTYSTSQFKLLEEKRMMELYELAARTQEPFANREGLWNGVVETVAPGRKRQFVKSQDQVQAEQQAAQAAQSAEEQAHMDKMRQAQEYAAMVGRQTAQTESVVRSAQAQGRPIAEIAPIPSSGETPEADELGAEFANLTEDMR